MNKEKIDKKCKYVSKLLIAYVMIPMLLGLIMQVLLTRYYIVEIKTKQAKKNDIETITEENFNYEYENEIIVCVTKYGSKYHIDDCPYAKNTYEILNLSEAEQRGYKPCSYCCY